MSEPPPAARLWDLVRGALGTKALGIVADLGVADVLAGGPRPVDEVAREVGADADTLHRLLRALASDGVFAEVAPGVFGNTEASELLRRQAGGTSPTSSAASGTAPWTIWRERRIARRSRVRSARTSGPGSPISRRSALRSTARWSRERSVASTGWRESSGVTARQSSTLAAATARCSSSSSGGIRACAASCSICPRRTATRQPCGEGCAFVAGSFFERVPRGETSTSSGPILHDWDDDRAGAILRTIRDAAAADAPRPHLDAVVPAGNEPHGSEVARPADAR